MLANHEEIDRGADRSGPSLNCPYTITLELPYDQRFDGSHCTFSFRLDDWRSSRLRGGRPDALAAQ